MSVRSWQNTLVDAFVAAVAEQDQRGIELAAHNLAVHVAHTQEAFTVLKEILITGSQSWPPGKRAGETDTASMFWEKMRTQGLLERVSADDQEYAQTPWPGGDCD